MASASRSPLDQDRSARRPSHSDNGAPRELSPFSARRALTMRLAAQNSPAASLRGGEDGLGGNGRGDRSGSRETMASRDSYRRSEGRPRSRSQGPKPRNRWDKSPELAMRGSRNRSRSRSRDRKPPRQPSQDSKARSLKEATPASRRGREPSGSPEPYRPPRERSHERRRDRSADRKRDRSGERRRNRSRSRERRDRSGGRNRDRSRDKRRESSRERRNDRSKDRKRDRSRDRYRDRSRDRRRDRSRDRKRDRSRSPSPPRHHRRSSRSPTPNKRRKHSRSASPPRRSRAPLPDQEVSFRGLDDSAQPPTKYGGAPPDREKPNFKPTGLLAKEANKVEGTKISLKYHEPPNARKPPPSSPWRLFIFKGDETLDNVDLSTRSCWLLGRAREVADIPLDHPSCSSQHAAIQFRYIEKTVEDNYGVRQKRGKVKPYIIDLESSNGTELNGEDIEKGRYVELRDKDILRFGASEREYMVMLPPKEV